MLFDLSFLLPHSCAQHTVTPAMDASEEKMMDFAIIPIETLIACRYILLQVNSIIDSNISLHGYLHSLDIHAFQTHYSQAKDLFESRNTVWPLIVKQPSRIYDKITGLIENAAEWLERSAFSTLFAEDSKNLKKYLKRQPGFSASRLPTHRDGAVWGRYLVVLEQRKLMQTYKNDFDQLQYFCINGHDEMKNFEKFLMILTWMREEPLRRMFSKEFSGTYLENESEVQDDPVSNHGSLAGKWTRSSFWYSSLSNTVLDTESVVDILTPSTTPTTSPALTERSYEKWWNKK